MPEDVQSGAEPQAAAAPAQAAPAAESQPSTPETPAQATGRTITIRGQQHSLTDQEYEQLAAYGGEYLAQLREESAKGGKHEAPPPVPSGEPKDAGSEVASLRTMIDELKGNLADMRREGKAKDIRGEVDDAMTGDAYFKGLPKEIRDIDKQRIYTLMATQGISGKEAVAHLAKLHSKHESLRNREVVSSKLGDQKRPPDAAGGAAAGNQKKWTRQDLETGAIRKSVATQIDAALRNR